MHVTRRRFLRTGAGLAVAAALPAGCRTLAPAAGDEAGIGAVFAHGVASGDPLGDRVVLWTRVTPAPGTRERLAVRWEIAHDPALTQVVARGTCDTGPERDYTVKIDAAPLGPGRTWYYRFASGDALSPIGRTRTLPVGPLARARFAVCSCSNYSHGYFNAYASMAARDDLDAVLHLGDYIYEYGPDEYVGPAGLGRDLDPAHEIVSLADYRRRYAQYRADPDLQEVHRQHPMIAVWDDHESANDSWMRGAQNHQPESEGEWGARKAAAMQSYFEWMPIRALPADLRSGRIHRSFRYGDLVDLVMLDTRLRGRDAQAARDDLVTMQDPRRSLLGAEQEAWLAAELEASRDAGTAWRVLGQQVMLGQLALPGESANGDGWDGYRAARERLLGHLEAERIRDVVVLTGDFHSSWAMDVSADPFSERAYDPDTGRGALAVELVTPAVSSSSLGNVPGIRESLANLATTHPHLRFVDLDQHGYLILDVDRERVQADWFWQDTVMERRAAERFGRAVATERGSSHLVEVREPSPARPAA